MKTNQKITYSEPHALVMKLSVDKLSIAYRLLKDLNDTDILSFQENFLLLPIDERRRLMAEQTEQMKEYYRQTYSERQEWQAGEFVEY